MSAIFSYHDSRKKLEEIDFKTLVKHYVNDQKLTMNKLSRLIGKSSGFISQHIRGKNISLPLLIALSHHLQVNLLEPFMNLLPQNLQPTEHEKQLQQQLSDLQKQYDDLKKERDMLKEIVMK